MTAYTGHGGGCCGISHAFGIGDNPQQSNVYGRFSGTSRQCLEQIITGHGTTTHRTLEVVTAEGDGFHQTSAWEDTLASLGFQKVSSFINSNSNNECTVWHRHPDLTLYGNERQPGTVEQVERVVEREVEVPARQEVRAVLVEYYPNFRATGRGRMFSSAEEVREAHPLIRRIDRRTIMSDGTINWEDNV